MTYPRNSRRAKLHRFNWGVLLFCALMFATGGTLCGIGAFILAGTQGATPVAYIVAIMMSFGLFLASGVAFCEMERC
jgi:hypothetical protein